MKYVAPVTDKENRALKNELSKNISRNIKKIRKAQNMTQQTLAEKTGLHLTYIGHLEAGKYHPSTFVLWKISRALKISLDEFVK